VNAVSEDSSIIKQSFRYFTANAGSISLLILPPALLGGLLQALILKSFFIDKKAFPILDSYLGSPGTGGLFIMVSQLIIMMFWVGALIYLMKCIVPGEKKMETGESGVFLKYDSGVSVTLKPPLREVLAQGFASWGKLAWLAFIIFLVSWGPGYTTAFFHMNHGWVFNAVMVWVIAVMFIFMWRYALVFPVLLVEKMSIILSLKMAAILSEGRRAKIMLISVLLVLFPYLGSFAVALLLAFLTEPLQSQLMINLVVNSIGECFIKWFLLAPVFIALYLMYQRVRNELDALGLQFR